MAHPLMTPTAPGTYMVHARGQSPVQGIAVWHYERNDIWRCECCGTNHETSRPDCVHVQFVKREARREILSESRRPK